MFCKDAIEFDEFSATEQIDNRNIFFHRKSFCILQAMKGNNQSHDVAINNIKLISSRLRFPLALSPATEQFIKRKVQTKYLFALHLSGCEVA